MQLSKKIVLWEGFFCSDTSIKINLLAQLPEKSYKHPRRDEKRWLHEKMPPCLAFPGDQSPWALHGATARMAVCEKGLKTTSKLPMQSSGRRVVELKPVKVFRARGTMAGQAAEISPAAL